MAMRRASKAQKRLLFIKFYNFAVEVYDSPGFGIGCRRSCGQQEWELISHEVILQLLFSCARSLNTSNTSFSLLFVYDYANTFLFSGAARASFSKEEKSGRWFPLRVRARRVNDASMFVKMRDQHTPGWWDYSAKIT